MAKYIMSFDTKDLLGKTATVNVDLRNYGQWKIRLLVASWLFRLAAWIAWCDIEFETDNDGLDE